MIQHAFEILFVLLAGLAGGSFATALVWRVPRGIPWVIINGKGRTNRRFARSSCPYCNKTLLSKDLIPIFSWFLLKGKCRHCGGKIGFLYPVIETLTVAACLGIYAVWGFTVPAFIIMAAMPLLAALLFIDLEHMILPNQLVLILAVMAAILILYQCVVYGLSYGFGEQALLKLAGMAVFALVALGLGRGAEIILKKEALGMGDVKFFATAGLWLGITWLPFFLICGGAAGVALGAFYKFYLKKQPFPFGPALILALYAGLVLQGLEIVPLVGVQ